MSVGGFILLLMVAYMVLQDCSLFSVKKAKKGFIYDSIVSQTWLWVNNRRKKGNVNWVAWLKDPLDAISSV